MTRLVSGALLLISLLLPLCALAQGDEAETGDSGPGMRRYTAAGYGFELSLPETGEITDPKSRGWENEAEVAVEWSSENTPVVLIQARVDDLGDTIDGEIFTVFCDSLEENWKADPQHYEVVSREPGINIGSYQWHLLEIADSSSGKDNMVYYSVFSTYQGGRIYTISLYYLQPTDKLVRDFGKPVLQSFRVR